MPDIKQLSENGTQFYPETHVTAVIDGNGSSVDTLLSGKQNTLVSGTNIKTINNTSLLGSGNISITSSSGTVTSVKMTVPTGLSVSGSPITTSGTLAVSLATGYKIPTTTELSNLAPKASPALTGTPTAPTATAGTNTTQIATTAFVQSAVSSAGGGTVSSVGMTVPTGLSVSGSPVTSSGTLAVSLASGYTIPTTTEMNGKEVTTNKVTSLSSSSTDTQYPSAKCVHTALKSFPKYAHLENESEMPVSPASDTMYLIDSDTSAQYAKYHLCANMTEYNNIANKDSQTLYLIPKTS